MSQFIIEAKGIHKIYERPKAAPIEVLKGIDLFVKTGEFVTIMGPSGAGKSTLLHILGLIERPTQGKVYFMGMDTSEMDEKQRAKIRNNSIGFVFQAHYLLSEFTALENVMIPLLIKGKKNSEAKALAERILQDVGLKERLEHRPSELSGGEQQRVAVARAIVNSPSLLLADEPTGNLDRETGFELIKLLLSLYRQKGMSVIMVTHDPSLASLSERTIKLVDGRIVNELE